VTSARLADRVAAESSATHPGRAERRAPEHTGLENGGRYRANRAGSTRVADSLTTVRAENPIRSVTRTATVIANGPSAHPLEGYGLC
jgi:hypothetical protein